ncbi:MAG: HAD family hydrolase [Planctomycetota bacterium]
MITRIAMWSGPRNISTALMRSFGSRPDTHVSDEPLYAHYLASTGASHPRADEIIDQHEVDWAVVASKLTGPTPSGETVWYQKHMAHHLLPAIDRSWLEGFRHAFLIREPRAMLASLVAKLGDARLEDTGLPQQVKIFRWVESVTGETPPVVVGTDIQRDPAGVLAALCAALGLEFDDAMLSWDTGPRSTDGCWGPFWYGNTYRSTGFAPYLHREVDLAPAYRVLATECQELYDQLAVHSIQTDASRA